MSGSWRAWRRNAVLIGAVLGLHAAPAMAVDAEVNANGFPATLSDPRPSGPLIVMVAGSGPTDRNGNSILGISASYMRKLADALADRGMATLRYDKRGVAGSVPVVAEEEILFQTFVDDLGDVIDWADHRFPQRRIVLLGHSEGGLVALRAARSRRNLAGLLLLATPGRPLAETLGDQLLALSAPHRERAQDILEELEAGDQVHDVPPELLGLFRPSVQNFVISMLALRPAQNVRALRLPVLVIGGGTDIQVGRFDFEALARARPNVQSRWFAHMNHVLVDASPTRSPNIATYNAPETPLTEGLPDTIADFVERLGRAEP